MAIVKCPTCNKNVDWNENSEWKPFCSERCKLIDLGAWFTEERGIAGDETVSHEESDSPQH